MSREPFLPGACNLRGFDRRRRPQLPPPNRQTRGSAIRVHLRIVPMVRVAAGALWLRAPFCWLFPRGRVRSRAQELLGYGCCSRSPPRVGKAGSGGDSGIHKSIESPL